MGKQIKYTNDNGLEITELDSRDLHGYNKTTIVSGSIKMIESFMRIDDADFVFVSYYLDLSENKENILQYYLNQPGDFLCEFFFNKQSSGEFNLWDFESYNKNGELKFKGKITYDGLNRIICYCLLDLVTDQPIRHPFKCYYGNIVGNKLGDALIKITYLSNGEVYSINDKQESFGYIKPISLYKYLEDKEFSQEIFPWDKHPYYHSLLPYLPRGEL